MKYKSIKTTVDNINFASKAEAARYNELKLLQRAGEVKAIILQPSFLLEGGVRYRADFAVIGIDGYWLEDVKGVETQAFKIKKRQMAARYPEWELRLVR
jgi:dsDNA-binding SOS-regulon protein